MNRLIKIFFTFLILSGCAYEPVLLKKNYDFYFTDIKSEGEKQINQIIKQNLTENTNIESINNYQIFFESKLSKDIVASNKKGDPTIYRISINLNYNVLIKFFKNNIKNLNNFNKSCYYIIYIMIKCI